MIDKDLRVKLLRQFCYHASKLALSSRHRFAFGQVDHLV